MKKKRFKIILISLLAFFFSFNSYAYSLNILENSQVVRWPSSGQTLHLAVNPDNSFGASSSQVMQIVQSSADQWQSSARELKMNIYPTSSKQMVPERNSMYFSNNPLFFNGEGVAGVTIIQSRSQDGRIVKGDILLNDSLFFSADPMMNNHFFYLGNVVSHELGHFIGAGHSQTNGATMFYKLLAYQHQLSHDDQAVAQKLWGKKNHYASLKGQVQGGKGIAVFGAYVEAISRLSGEVIAGALSDEKGHFEIVGLKQGDDYQLVVSNIKNRASYSSFYHNVRTDFCHSRRSYTTSFVSSCANRKKGLINTITLNRATKDVGVISIGCNIDSPMGYRINKEDIWRVDKRYFEQDYGLSFPGYFTKREVDQQLSDMIEIDLSEIDFSHVMESLFLRIFIGTEDFFSPLKTHLRVTRIDGVTQEIQGPSLEGLFYKNGKKTTNLLVDLPIDKHDMSRNIFTVEIIPERLHDFVNQHLTLSMDDLLPSAGLYANDRYFYLAQFNIIKSSGAERLLYKSSNNWTDNAACLDAPETYQTAGSLFFKQQDLGAEKEGSTAREEIPLICGNIQTPSGGSGGQAPLVILMLISVFIILDQMKKNSRSVCLPSSFV